MKTIKKLPNSFLKNYNPKNKSLCNDNIAGKIMFNNITKNFHYNNGNILNLLNTLNKTQNYQKRKKINYSSIYRLNYYKKIIILMESPHIDEFNPQFKYINIAKPKFNGPAYGKTGSKINNYLIDIINNNFNKINSIINLNRKCSFKIYLVNAIRFQCSLGNKPIIKKIRNSAFIYLWKNKFDSDLYNRLNYLKPDLIINCCTSYLKKYCNTYIIKTKVNAPILDAYHPSVWTKNTQLH